MGDDKMKVKAPYRGGIVEGPSAEIVAEAIADMERRRRVEELRRERWGTDGAEQMARLCAAFPSLARAPGTDPWEVEPFLWWACGPAPSSGALHAARFVLSVWNGAVDWAAAAADLEIEGAACLTPFDLTAAWSVWDQQHRGAVMAWLELPFWP